MPTNLSMDLGTFRAIRLGGFRFSCPACSRQHVWSQDEAWIAGAAPEPAPPGGPRVAPS